MSKHAYYEINRWHSGGFGLNVSVFPGNMILNRQHWQNGIEVLYPIVGTLRVNIEGKEYFLSEGDLITIDSGLLHEVRSEKTNYLQMIFNVDDKLMRRTEDSLICLATVGENAISRDCSDIISIKKSIARLMRIFSGSMGYGSEPEEEKGQESVVGNQAWYAGRIELNRVLMILSRYLVPSDFTSRKADHDFVRLIYEIHNHYDKPLDAKTLAKRLGYGESTIFRLIREHTGMSFGQYLNSVRISIACGIPTSSNFYRVFKTLVGLTPSEYRKHALDYSNIKRSGQDEILNYNIFQNMDVLPYDLDEIFNAIERDYSQSEGQK